MSGDSGLPAPKSGAPPSPERGDSSSHGTNDPWWRPLREAAQHVFKVVTAIGSHTIIATAIIAAIFVIEHLLDALVPGLKLFATVPVKYLFNGADSAVIVAFVISSAVEAWKAMRK